MWLNPAPVPRYVLIGSPLYRHGAARVRLVLALAKASAFADARTSVYNAITHV